MATRLTLEHETTYRYDHPVHLSPHVIRLCPGVQAPARVEAYVLTITPTPGTLRWQEDAWRNRVARAWFDDPTRALTIAVRLDVALAPINPFDFVVAPHAAHVPFRYDHDERLALRAFLDIEPSGPRFAQWAQALRERLLPGHPGTVDLVVEVNRQVKDAIHYVARNEPGVQSCERTLELGQGSCRDSAWLLAQTLRRFGVATRFVSGYLVQLGAHDADDDSVALHAWCDAYVPGAGWIGLDATSGLVAAEHHIPLAVAAAPEATAPVEGCADRSESHLSWRMAVNRRAE